eukprot:Nitzschia sp. Nitz4//scaffold35_size145790//23246//25011//NITZ4_003012-RA/size145790-augustus-gene-0.112-mRNA-1//1//CDS//3329549070//3621//frame0
MESIAAEVSLHCIICFEEFDVKDRPPVVLPCGHTYVCIVCAKRLRKCMECREPLYWTPPPPQSKPTAVLGNPALINTRSPAHIRYARGRYSQSPQTPPHPAMNAPPVKEEPQPLPLPKNTVLMAMIEAADRQKRILRQETSNRPGIIEDDEEDADADSDDDDQSLNQLDPILVGADAFVGTCGTYAVREPLGLAVLPFDPNKQHHPDADTDQQATTQEEKKLDEKEPFKIEQGQKVQVVSVDEGVYKLARGCGYIVASVNQLVKVAAPQETSCQYEGMLESIQKKQQDLERELSQINLLVHGLKNKIAVEQALLPEFPVISPPKSEESPSVNDENDEQPSSPVTPTKEEQARSSPPLHLTASSSSTEVQLGHPRTPAQNTPPLAESYVHSPAHSCPMPTTVLDASLAHPFMDGAPAGLPRYRVNTADDLPWSFGCGSALFGERLIENDCDAGNMMALSFDDASLVEGGGRGAVARSLAARSIQQTNSLGPEASLRSGSFEGPINFRTGMSGHTGLSLSRKKSSPLSRPHVRMMSEHRGIAATGRNHHPNAQRRPPGMMHPID